MWEIIIPILLLYLLYRWLKKGKNILSDIPGPKGSLLVGNFFQLDQKAPHRTIHEWSKQYGPMFKFTRFSQNSVVVADYEAIQEVLLSTDCASRLSSYRFEHVLLKGWTDVITAKYSHEMNERKKLLTRSLNAYGTSMSKIENTTLEYIEELHEDLRRETQEMTCSIDIRVLLYECVAGIVMSLLYGRKMDKNVKLQLIELEKGALKMSSPNELTALIDVLPLFRYLPIGAIQKPLKDALDFRQWFIDRYEENKTTDQGKESILAALKQFINKATGKVMESTDILGITMNTVGAGFLTTTSSLYSLILVLINHPNIQDQVYGEIQRVTGGEAPTLADRPNLPYTCAVLEENLRHSSIVPLALPHYSMKDTTIQGRAIPKDTMIFPALWTCHHDERYFPEPWKFNPERYLSSEGELLPLSHDVMRHSMTFSAGKRICPGEGLARSRMFLVVTSLLHWYKFLPQDDDNIPSCDPRLHEGHVVVGPVPYKVRLQLRSVQNAT